MSTEKRVFWLPIRPYNVIAAVNRISLATGSIRAAMCAEGVDYNGHSVGFVPPNSFKRYWTCYYTWAGTRTIGRGSLADCLRAAKSEYDRGALGATARVAVETVEDAAACVAAGFEPWSEEIERAHSATWRTPMHAEVNAALDLDRHFSIGAVGMLCNSKTLDEYKARLDAAFAERKARHARIG